MPTEQELIGLINVTGGLMALHLVVPYTRWIIRDWRSLSRIAAGLLVFVFLFAMVLRGYESLYYGAARFLHIEGVDLWRDPPWVMLVVAVRSAGLLLLLAAYAAKQRADGMQWRRVFRKTGLFALEGVAIAGACYWLLIA